MRICTLAGVEIRCGAAFVLLCIFVCLSGNGMGLALYMAALLLHEAAHAVMAGLLGYRVCSIDIAPYGCVARIPRLNGHIDELLIALAGPLFSALMYMGCRLAEAGWATEFAFANRYLALINLLPVYPLDGGRALDSLLSMKELRLPRPVALILGAAVSLAVLGVGWAERNATVMVFGAFMLLSAAKGGERSNFATEHLRRSGSLMSGAPIEMKHIALYHGATLAGAAACLGGSRYVLIWVLDEDMRIVGSIEGEAIVELAAKLGGSSTLADALGIDRAAV